MNLKILLNRNNTSNNTGKTVEELQAEGYTYFAKAKDKFLSGWGGSGAKGHNQIVLCKSFSDARKISYKMGDDNTLKYCNYHSVENLILDSKQTYSINIADNCPLWYNK
jgi:hypothetical protein